MRQNLSIEKAISEKMSDQLDKMSLENKAKPIQLFLTITFTRLLEIENFLERIFCYFPIILMMEKNYKKSLSFIPSYSLQDR